VGKADGWMCGGGWWCTGGRGRRKKRKGDGAHASKVVLAFVPRLSPQRPALLTKRNQSRDLWPLRSMRRSTRGCQSVVQSVKYNSVAHAVFVALLCNASASFLFSSFLVLSSVVFFFFFSLTLLQHSLSASVSSYHCCCVSEWSFFGCTRLIALLLIKTQKATRCPITFLRGLGGEKPSSPARHLNSLWRRMICSFSAKRPADWEVGRIFFKLR